jgi:bifunctional DNA-binding transcriptional regulator/antitoxin component of YhaV-PrlF toxin-antitoxin module
VIKLSTNKTIKLPESVLADMGLKPGDGLVVVEASDGIRLVKQDACVKQAALARYVLGQSTA